MSEKSFCFEKSFSRDICIIDVSPVDRLTELLVTGVTRSSPPTPRSSDSGGAAQTSSGLQWMQARRRDAKATRVSRCARRRRSISAAAESRSSGSAAVAGSGKRRERRGADGGGGGGGVGVGGSSLRFISVSVSVRGRSRERSVEYVFLRESLTTRVTTTTTTKIRDGG